MTVEKCGGITTTATCGGLNLYRFVVYLVPGTLVPCTLESISIESRKYLSQGLARMVSYSSRSRVSRGPQRSVSSRSCARYSYQREQKQRVQRMPRCLLGISPRSTTDERIPARTDEIPDFVHAQRRRCHAVLISYVSINLRHERVWVLLFHLASVSPPWRIPPVWLLSNKDGGV